MPTAAKAKPMRTAAGKHSPTQGVSVSPRIAMTTRNTAE